MRVDFYDTTLRDGAQSEDIAFSVNDKLRITERLDDFGMDFIEGGWPGSNPRDLEYFEEVKKLRLGHARIVAFSSTMRPGSLADPERDEIMQSLPSAETEHVAVVGKSWDLHVRDALKVSLDTNLKMIEGTIRYLKERGRTVFFDAEHFFDGYRGNRQYALKVVKAAAEAGADVVVLCDTNGGTMPFEIGDVVDRSALRSLQVAARHPLPQRHGDGGRQHAHGGAGGVHARAGHDQRVRRAVRQREPLLRHPQPDPEDGLRGHDAREAGRACATSRSSSTRWPTSSPTSTGPTWGTRPSRTRAAFT